MKLKRSPYWAPLVEAVLAVAFLAKGLAGTTSCHIQDIGPMVCTDTGADWTWAGDALLAVAIVTAIATVIVRRYRRRT